MFMKTRGARLAVYLAAAALLTGAGSMVAANSSVSPGATVSSAAAPSDALVSKRIKRADAIARWTPRAMRQARPMPAVQVQAEGAGDPDPQSHGGGFTYPTPFDRYNVYPNRTALPYRQVGKLFFTQNGLNYVCSATSIGGRGIFTAGHCVSDGTSTFSTNVVFVPQRNNGSSPQGMFACNELWVATEWHVNGNLRRDLGSADGCVRTSDGALLHNVVGAMGLAINRVNSDEHFNSFGYPAAAPFNGERMVQCQSSFGHVDTLGIGGTGPLPFAIGCDMTGGSSGGPWVININGTAGASNNLLNGVNSYKYVSPSQPLEMYSPYFDSLAQSVYDASAD